MWGRDSRSLYFDERNAVRQITLDGEVMQTVAELPPRSAWMGLLRSGSQFTLYEKLSNGRVGYMRIQAMNGPFLRQFREGAEREP